MTWDNELDDARAPRVWFEPRGALSVVGTPTSQRSMTTRGDAAKEWPRSLPVFAPSELPGI